MQLELELELDVQLEVSGFPFFNTSQWEKKEKNQLNMFKLCLLIGVKLNVKLLIKAIRDNSEEIP